MIAEPIAPPSAAETLSAELKELEAIIPPLWPLADYVAVNPLLGLADHSLLRAADRLNRVRDCRLLMPRSYFQALWSQQQITVADLTSALADCREEEPQRFASLTVGAIGAWLTSAENEPASSPSRFRTVAEWVDAQVRGDWLGHVVNDISRHCAAHYDEGQASWPSPWAERSLYEAWQQAAQRGYRLDLLGLHGFRERSAQLPREPVAAIAQLVHELGVPAEARLEFLLCQLFSVSGWASYAKYRVREAERAGERNDDLLGLLALRLAYEAALAHTFGPVPWAELRLSSEGEQAKAKEHGTASERAEFALLASYVCQVAREGAYRRELVEKLQSTPAQPSEAARPAAQMVFCIDVRSERFRRQLEQVTDQVETFGFAGFFGIAMEYVPLGESQGVPQCPVLLTPNCSIPETLAGAEKGELRQVVEQHRIVRRARKAWKQFQTSAVSCFSFVEALGWSSGLQLLADTLRLKPQRAKQGAGATTQHSLCHVEPDLVAHGPTGLSPMRQIDMAEAILRNLGLTTRFARLVLFCGHGAEVENNPYKAGLDCGACGGHTGEPNARVAAQLLNQPAVRLALQERGLTIAPDTWFLAAVHNTTTDSIRICDEHRVPASHQRELGVLQEWLVEAGSGTRRERCPQLGTDNERDPHRRSCDWSEVRPEWGLAGNAAFIVAPRWRTRGVDLEGRTFLHSYDHRHDPGFKVLELIMTAPMVVTNWINMQYYASTVDNHAFGSGNKTLHNVVGQFGVFEGNSGDLRTGLPWQSVHDGQQYRHEPLRLLVLLEAPRTAIAEILDRHANVRDLVRNGWLGIVAREEHHFYRWQLSGWESVGESK